MAGEVLLYAAVAVAGGAVLTGGLALRACSAGIRPPASGPSSASGQDPASGRSAAFGRSGLAAEQGWWVASRSLTWLLAMVLVGAVLYMVLSLWAGDFSLLYVWKHTATYEPLIYRLMAVLAGQEGSLLVWSMLTALAAVGTAEYCFRRFREARDDSALRVHTVVLAVLCGLLLLTAQSAPFASFSSAFPQVEPGAVPVEGTGLNPALRNLWMPLHTLLTFAGYALVTIAFAIGTTRLVAAARGRLAEARGWHVALVHVTRWGWIMLSLALLTGVVWAYEEMTFGWFWSWDPVEAAALMIWLVLTAALHVLTRQTRNRVPVVWGSFLAGVALVVAVFASFVTRSGLHPSVHAFASGTIGGYLGVFMVALGAPLMVWVTRAWRRTAAMDAAQHQERLGGRGGGMSGQGSVPAEWVAAGLLLAAGALIGWGIIYPILGSLMAGSAVDLDVRFFNLWGYPLALVILFFLGYGIRGPAKGRQGDLALLWFFAGLTVVAAFIRPVAGLAFLPAEERVWAGGLYQLFGQVSVLSLFPAVVYAGLGVLERWWLQALGASARVQVRETGIAFLHAGVILLVAGITLSTLFASTSTVAVNPPAGRSAAANGMQVQLLGVDRAETVDARGTVVESLELASLRVYSHDRPVAGGIARLATYPDQDQRRHAQVMITRDWFMDTHVIYRGQAEMGPEGVPVTIRRVPAINLVWGGLILFPAGLGLVMIGRAWPGGKTSHHGRGKRDVQ